MSTAMVAQQPQPAEQPANTWNEAQYLVCDLTVELRVPNFAVRDLLRLERGSIVDSQCKQAANLPLNINGQMVAWAEFELLGDRLAIRLMELV